MPKSFSRLLTVKQLAALLGVSSSYIYKMTHRDVIPRVYINGTALRFDIHQIEEWLRAQPRKRRRPRQEEA